MCDGSVSKCLVDGGCALEKSLLDNNVMQRRCFAHVARMPHSRGGGYRGGKGSLPRYLLDRGVAQKEMSKVRFLVSWLSFVFYYQ